MIPKIIHYIWLSNESFSDLALKCMESWKRHLPDYELRLWDFNRFNKQSSLWVKEAFDAGKYAFAADYIRLYALYNEGGIYLDSDVEVLKSFDDLLHLPYFVGEEYDRQFTHYKLEGAIIGAEKGCEWVGKCMKWYEDRSFILERNSYFLNPLPSVIKRTIEENYTLKWVNYPEQISRNEQEVSVLPIEYFSPKSWETKQIVRLSADTYTIHHFDMSWVRRRTYWKYAVDTLKHAAYKIVKTLQATPLRKD